MYHTLFVLLFLDTKCGDQGTDADPCSTEVIDFINLQAGIDLVAAC